jgi:beta-catenin-like protein 1
LASYKRKDPKDGDEVEMMENLFDCVCSLVAEQELKEMFIAEEGVELMLIILREKKMARMRALKVLGHVVLGKGAKESCERFVENSGLKTLFPIFMRKGMKAYKKEYSSYSEVEEDGRSLLLRCYVLFEPKTSISSDIYY